jgi:hypothetical protein
MTDGMRNGAVGYVLAQWARGEVDASDALDRVRELGGDVTATQYRLMREVDAGRVLVPTETYAVGGRERSQWSRDVMAGWAGLD